MRRTSFLFFLLLSYGCARESPVGERIEEEASGVRFVLRIAEKLPENERVEIQRTVAATLDQILSLTSSSLLDSDVSRLNRAEAGVKTPVSVETFAMIQEAVRASELTGGAFDLTASPLARLWPFGPDASASPPSEDEIDRELARVGYKHLVLDDDAIAITKRIGSLEIDLAGLATGHALDLAAAALEERGYKDYLLEAGASVRTRGKDPAGRPWLVPIPKPGPGRGEVQRSIPLSGFAMATAGRLDTHLVDPRSGRPLEHELLSVTVLGERCLTARAMAMGLLVLGPQEGLRIAAAQDLAALFLVRSEKGDLEERATPAFAELFF
jgi:FAD:protein FMN transferase